MEGNGHPSKCERSGQPPFPGQLLSRRTAGSRAWLLFLCAFQRCPSPHCWVTQPGGLLWLSCSFSVELLSKETNHHPAHSTRRWGSKTPRTIESSVPVGWNSWRRCFIFFLLRSQGAFFFPSSFFFFFPNTDIDYEGIILKCKRGSASLGNRPAPLENKDSL